MKAHSDIQLVVSIRSHDHKGQRQVRDMLYEWLESYGHTSKDYGFDFIDVGVMTAKRLSKAPSLKKD